MEFISQASTLLNGLNNRLSSSAYDIAWGARVRNGSPTSPRWGNLVTWLLEHQWADGSWGGAIPYRHDRVLCTLASVISLVKNGCDKSHPEVIRRAQNYLWQNLHLLHYDLMELVGFELILPTLLEEAHQIGLKLPSHSYGYGTLRDKKLSLLPLDLIYSPNTSLAFSLEFLGEHPPIDKIQGVMAEHGAIANSPATTAYYALHSNDPRALDFLETVQNGSGGLPSFYPFRDFEMVWVLQHLSYGGVALSEFVPAHIWEHLHRDLTPQGIGIDPLFGINDGDTTSVTLHVMALGQQEISHDILRRFEHPHKRTFQTFFFERNMSVITNIHALEALMCMPDYPQREVVWNCIISALLDQRRYESFWIDKWHISPYYATAHTLIALLNGHETAIVQNSNSLEWFINTQRPDGSWGYFDRGTSEETAYALLALLYYNQFVGQIDRAMLQRGIEFLQRNLGKPHPELWIAKTLYTPHDIVEAAIWSALSLYKQTFGSL